MHWSFRLATVAVGLTFLHFHSASNSSADEFDARVGKWDAWSKHVRTWPVRTKATYSDQDPTDYNDRLLMPVDSEHYCLQLDYQSGGQQQRQVILRNPSYMAELARGLDDHWVIVGLTHSTEEKFGESLERGRSMNYFRRDVADPGSLLRKILNERESLSVISERDGQFSVFQLLPKSNGKPEPGTLFAISSRFVIWFEDHASPSRIDYSYPGPDNETVNVSRVFDGWREVDGVDVPSRDRVFCQKGIPKRTSRWKQSPLITHPSTLRSVVASVTYRFMGSLNPAAGMVLDLCGSDWPYLAWLSARQEYTSGDEHEQKFSVANNITFQGEATGIHRHGTFDRCRGHGCTAGVVAADCSKSQSLSAPNGLPEQAAADQSCDSWV